MYLEKLRRICSEITLDRNFSVISVAETLQNFLKNEALIAGINVLY